MARVRDIEQEMAQEFPQLPRDERPKAYREKNATQLALGLAGIGEALLVFAAIGVGLSKGVNPALAGGTALGFNLAIDGIAYTTYKLARLFPAQSRRTKRG